MKNHLLIDTDILIDVGRNDQVAVKRLLAEKEKENILSISAITEMELIVGCRNKLELKALDKFLSGFEIFLLSDEITLTSFRLLKQYRLSHGLLLPDSLIAATALTYNADFLTKNRKDYIFIENIRLVPYK